jgi:catechol 2,3-dioxygenase-like lactoylglutathione lyase family enzyme
MPVNLLNVTLIVRDYDEARDFYTGRLGFHVIEDTDLGGDKRWLRVAPNSVAGPCLLLARAVDDTQAALIGNQGGGRVWLFFETDNIDRDYAAWTRSGVRFHEPVRSEVYGRVAVFEDIYGNRFDLIESRR